MTPVGQTAMPLLKGLTRSGQACALILILLIQLLPFYFALGTALKPATDASSQLLFPLADATFDNFTSAIIEGGILRATFNSVVVTALSTALVCLIGLAAAYPLARRRTRISGGITFGFVAMLMIPPLTLLVPLYSLLLAMGALNTYWGAAIVMAANNLPLAVFLYANFIRSVPISIEEAAAMDGAGYLKRLWVILLPTLKPVTATVVLLTSVGVWNEFALLRYILSDASLRTIAPTIAAYTTAQSSNLGAAAAAALISAIPIVIAFVFLQKYFIRGVVTGAEK